MVFYAAWGGWCSGGVRSAIVSVLRKDGRGGEAVLVLGAGVVQIFVTRHLEDGPAARVGAYDSSGAKSLGNQVGLQSDLDSATPQWSGFYPFRDFYEEPFAGHLGRAGCTACPMF